MFLGLLNKNGCFVLLEGEIIDDGVMLCDDGGELRDDSELRAFELVYEMIELSIHLLFFVLLAMDAELQLAGHSALEEEVD